MNIRQLGTLNVNDIDSNAIIDGTDKVLGTTYILSSDVMLFNDVEQLRSVFTSPRTSADKPKPKATTPPGKSPDGDSWLTSAPLNLKAASAALPSDAASPSFPTLCLKAQTLILGTRVEDKILHVTAANKRPSPLSVSRPESRTVSRQNSFVSLSALSSSPLSISTSHLSSSPHSVSMSNLSRSGSSFSQSSSCLVLNVEGYVRLGESTAQQVTGNLEQFASNKHAILSAIEGVLNLPHGDELIRNMMATDGDTTIVRLFHPVDNKFVYVRVSTNADENTTESNSATTVAVNVTRQYCVPILVKAYIALAVQCESENKHGFPLHQQMLGSRFNIQIVAKVLAGKAVKKLEVPKPVWPITANTFSNWIVNNKTYRSFVTEMDSLIEDVDALVLSFNDAQQAMFVDALKAIINNNDVLALDDCSVSHDLKGYILCNKDSNEKLTSLLGYVEKSYAHIKQNKALYQSIHGFANGLALANWIDSSNQLKVNTLLREAEKKYASNQADTEEICQSLKALIKPSHVKDALELLSDALSWSPCPQGAINLFNAVQKNLEKDCVLLVNTAKEIPFASAASAAVSAKHFYHVTSAHIDDMGTKLVTVKKTDSSNLSSVERDFTLEEFITLADSLTVVNGRELERENVKVLRAQKELYRSALPTIDLARRKHAELSVELESAETELAELREQQEFATSKLAELEADNEAKQREIAVALELQTKLQLLLQQSEIAKTDEFLSASATRSEPAVDHSVELETLQQKLAELESDLAQSKSRAEELRAAKTSAAAEIDELRTSNARLTDEMEQALNARLELVQEQAQALERAATLAAELEVARTSQQAARNAVQALQDEAANAELAKIAAEAKAQEAERAKGEAEARAREAELAKVAATTEMARIAADKAAKVAAKQEAAARVSAERDTTAVRLPEQAHISLEDGLSAPSLLRQPSDGMLEREPDSSEDILPPTSVKRSVTVNPVAKRFAAITLAGIGFGALAGGVAGLIVGLLAAPFTAGVSLPPLIVAGTLLGAAAGSAIGLTAAGIDYRVRMSKPIYDPVVVAKVIPSSDHSPKLVRKPAYSRQNLHEDAVPPIQELPGSKSKAAKSKGKAAKSKFPTHSAPLDIEHHDSDDDFTPVVHALPAPAASVSPVPSPVPSPRPASPRFSLSSSSLFSPGISSAVAGSAAAASVQLQPPQPEADAAPAPVVPLLASGSSASSGSPKSAGSSSPVSSSARIEESLNRLNIAAVPLPADEFNSHHLKARASAVGDAIDLTASVVPGSVAAVGSAPARCTSHKHASPKPVASDLGDFEQLAAKSALTESSFHEYDPECPGYQPEAEPVPRAVIFDAGEDLGDGYNGEHRGFEPSSGIKAGM